MGPILTQQVQSSVKMFSLIGSTIQDLIVHVKVACMWATSPKPSVSNDTSRGPSPQEFRFGWWVYRQPKLILHV